MAAFSRKPLRRRQTDQPTPHSEFRMGNGSRGSAHEAWRRRKSNWSALRTPCRVEAKRRRAHSALERLFSGIHFGMDDCRNEFCFDARPHLFPLPQERTTWRTASGWRESCPANPVARIFKETADDSPSPWGEGRDEGGRETNSGLVSRRLSARSLAMTEI